MTVADLLAERGITVALVIDDAYDDRPRADDLVDEDAWTNFFADVGPDRERIEELYPPYRDREATQLRTDDAFVSALWSNRGTLRTELVTPLFELYQQGVSTDLAFLGTLETELTALGLTVLKGGRDLPSGAENADIVFADLFLGTPQRDPDMQRSIDRLNGLLIDRRDNPPLVVLMSRSELLKEKRATFRDKARLIGAMFRVYSKNDLKDAPKLLRAVRRLATHQKDALRVVAFIRAWETRLDDATERFLAVIRRLDLPDYAQIQEILLEFEGQPLGSYLLDVFDRVLQHETEAEPSTITAAIGLGAINTKQYAPQHISGSPDLQELTYRSIWQHPKRLTVPGTVSGAPVSFGDVLIARNVLQPEQEGAQSPAALVALTASCDLVRAGGVKRILFMAGSLSDLTPASWSFEDQTLRTPIVIFDDGRRFWIRWSTKDLRMLEPSEIRALTEGEGKSYEIYRRLKEGHALQLQQALFADMGRVGVLTPMPGTFAVSVAAFTVASNDAVRQLNIPSLTRDGGVVYTGREGEDDVTRLVLTEEAADDLESIIAKTQEVDIHEKGRALLRSLQESSFFSDLQMGVTLPEQLKSKPARLKATVKDGTSKEVVLCIRNAELGSVDIKSLRQSGGLILSLGDTGFQLPLAEPEEGPGENQADAEAPDAAPGPAA